MICTIALTITLQVFPGEVMLDGHTTASRPRGHANSWFDNHPHLTQ